MKRKCIVVDLDNTLWGGVAGEDGVNGIELSLAGRGAGYLAFQQALRDLYDRGVILAINSRNNPNDALSIIREHPNMLLKETQFAAMRINWNDKVDNLRALAKELRIGLDSMVFLDDDPVNRAAVRSMLPEVAVPELPQEPEGYAPLLFSLSYFPSAAFTDEDKMRGNLYVTERMRMESEKRFPSRKDFLNDLKIKMYFHEDDGSALARLSQLTEKTNQFNIHKRMLGVADIAAFIGSPEHKVFHARVTDRFGDSGTIAFALVKTRKHSWHIKSMLMSCRVLQRGIEDAFLAAIAKRAQASGANELTICFVPSEKNKPAADFVARVFEGRALETARISVPAHIRMHSPRQAEN